LLGWSIGWLIVWLVDWLVSECGEREVRAFFYQNENPT